MHWVASTTTSMGVAFHIYLRDDGMYKVRRLDHGAKVWPDKLFNNFGSAHNYIVGRVNMVKEGLE